MKKKLLIVFVSLVFAVACKKDSSTRQPDTPVTPDTPVIPVTPVTKTPIAAAATDNKGQPGQMVNYATTRTITQDTIHALIGNNPVVLFKTGETQLSAYLPPLAAGDYDVKFKIGDQPYTSKATIDAYTPVTNAEAVANTYTAAIDTYIDNFKTINADTSSTAIKIPAEQLNFLTSAKTAFTTEWAKLSAADKMELAYQLKASQPDPALFKTLQSKSPLRVNVTYAQFEADLVLACKSYVFAYYLVNGVIIGNEALGWAAQKTGMPKLKLLAIITTAGVAATVFLYRKKLAEMVAQPFNLSFLDAVLAPNSVSPLRVQSLRTNATGPIVLLPKTAKALTISGSYRGLQASDANSPNTDIQDIVGIDSKIEKVWNGAKQTADALTGFFNISVIPPYPKAIPVTGKAAARSVTASLLSVDKVSDPSVKLTATNNTGGLVVSAESATTLTASKDFSFDVIYKFDALNLTLTKSVSAQLKYVAPPVVVDSIPIYTKMLAGTWKHITPPSSSSPNGNVDEFEVNEYGIGRRSKGTNADGSITVIPVGDSRNGLSFNVFKALSGGYYCNIEYGSLNLKYRFYPQKIEPAEYQVTDLNNTSFPKTILKRVN